MFRQDILNQYCLYIYNSNNIAKSYIYIKNILLFRSHLITCWFYVKFPIISVLMHVQLFLLSFQINLHIPRNIITVRLCNVRHVIVICLTVFYIVVSYLILLILVYFFFPVSIEYPYLIQVFTLPSCIHLTFYDIFLLRANCEITLDYIPTYLKYLLYTNKLRLFLYS